MHCWWFVTALKKVCKLQKPGRSAKTVAAFNKIYKEVIRVVKMGRQIFVKDKVIYDSFSFSATAKAQTAFRKSQSKEKDKLDTAAAKASYKGSVTGPFLLYLYTGLIVLTIIQLVTVSA